MNMHTQTTMGIIFGPTGSGKSDLATACAPMIHAEIVNIDIGQCYRPLTIGTAKPAWQHEVTPHHLFDIVEEPVDYSVIAYRQRAVQVCHTIWQKDRIPLFVGGSSFYIKSLLFPPRGPQSTDTRADEEDIRSNEQLWNELQMLDPIRASHIHPHDRYRILRALQVWNQTGQKPSCFVPELVLPADRVILIWIDRDRSELYHRIDQRVHEMFARGWIQEVSHLYGTAWEPFLLSKKLIGYDDIIRYLRNRQQDTTALLHTIQQKTRQYAKRQITFWQNLKKTLLGHHKILIHEISLSSCSIDEGAQQIRDLFRSNE